MADLLLNGIAIDCTWRNMIPHRRAQMLLYCDCPVVYQPSAIPDAEVLELRVCETVCGKHSRV